MNSFNVSTKNGKNMPTSYLRVAAIALFLGVYVGCSNVKFSKDESFCGKFGANFTLVNDTCFFTETFKAGGGKVDILIVNDNSASMSFEQRNLAARFNNFIQRLEDRHIDYRIAMTTTDISDRVANGTSGNPARAINGNGSLQDGNLITFANGSKYLTTLKAPASTADIAAQADLFAKAIQRPETHICEQFIADWIASGRTTSDVGYSQQYFDSCPSGDERGVYTANLVLNKNPDAFIRPGAHLAIIFLSDENVRSNLVASTLLTGTPDSSGNLIENFNLRYGSTKTLMVHSIVAKDNACVTSQSNQALGTPAVSATIGLVKGSIGTEYLAASTATGGVQGNVCATDYTTQLGDISVKLEEQISEIRLACANPVDLTVNIVGTNVVTYSVTGNIVNLSQSLPLGTSIEVRYGCKDL